MTATAEYTVSPLRKYTVSQKTCSLFVLTLATWQVECNSIIWSPSFHYTWPWRCIDAVGSIHKAASLLGSERQILFQHLAKNTSRVTKVIKNC